MKYLRFAGKPKSQVKKSVDLEECSEPVAKNLVVNLSSIHKFLSG